MRIYLLGLLEATTVALAVLTFLSAFLYSRRGLATRRTIAVSGLFGFLFLVSLWATAVVYKPSLGSAIGMLGCLVAVGIIFGAYWAIIYWKLPEIRKPVDQDHPEEKAAKIDTKH